MLLYNNIVHNINQSWGSYFYKVKKLLFQIITQKRLYDGYFFFYLNIVEKKQLKYLEMT